MLTRPSRTRRIAEMPPLASGSFVVVMSDIFTLTRFCSVFLVVECPHVTLFVCVRLSRREGMAEHLNSLVPLDGRRSRGTRNHMTRARWSFVFEATILLTQMIVLLGHFTRRGQIAGRGKDVETSGQHFRGTTVAPVSTLSASGKIWNEEETARSSQGNAVNRLIHRNAPALHMCVHARARNR
jgi:hypothetical protein